MPGSQGPKQSGSVIVPIDVPTQTSTILESHLIRFIGGELEFLPSSLLELDAYDSDDVVALDEFDWDFVEKSTTFKGSFCFMPDCARIWRRFEGVRGGFGGCGGV